MWIKWTVKPGTEAADISKALVTIHRKAGCFIVQRMLYSYRQLRRDLLYRYLRFWIIRPFKSTFFPKSKHDGRSQWPRGLRRRSAAARRLRLWVWIPPEAWISVCCECCVLSGRDLCVGLITPPGKSYWLCCVVVCDLETSWMRRPCPTGGCRAKNKQNKTS